MRIAVVGVGAVGGYFGARLAAAGEDVTFVARGDTLRALRSSGLLVESIAGDVALGAVQATDRTEEVGTVDAVILGVKAWQVEEAADGLRPLLGDESFVLPLQNGVEAPAQLARALGSDHVVAGLCRIVALRAGPAHIRHVGADPSVTLGELDGRSSERVDELRAALERAGVTVEISNDVDAALWKKFMLITSWAGVGAVTRQPIGVVRDTPESRSLLESSLAEIGALARARGMAVDDDAEARTLDFIDSIEPESTASMQRDLAEGRPSELEQLTGAVLRFAAESGVQAPVNTFCYRALVPSERRARSG